MRFLPPILLLVAAGCSENLLEPDASVDAGPSPDACTGGSHTVYLNRAPTTFTPGAMGDSVNNVSSLVTTEVTTAGASISETMWRVAKNCMIAELAPYDITVTDEDPGDVDHFEIVITERGTEIGLPFDVGGNAPFACPALPPRDLAFVFWGPHGQPRQRQFCESLMWTVAVSAGLTDSADCHDVMWPRVSDDEGAGACGDKTFLPEAVGCVEQSDLAPRDCACGGTIQKPHLRMIEHYGASTCAP